MNYRSIPILFIFILLISCGKDGYHTSEISGTRIPVDERIKADTSIENFVRPYANRINQSLDSILAYNPIDLNKSEGELNTAIGNLMADAVLEQANPIFNSRTGNNIDLVLLNHGGIRSTIPPGAVTARTAYSIMPFENEIVIVELTGEKVKEMLKYLESNRTAHPVSGIQIIVDKNYRITEATINGEEIQENRTYFVATSDYLQQGGDNMNFLKNPVNLYRTDYKIRNAFIDYFKKIDTIITVRDNRYIQKK